MQKNPFWIRSIKNSSFAEAGALTDLQLHDNPENLDENWPMTLTLIWTSQILMTSGS